MGGQSIKEHDQRIIQRVIQDELASGDDLNPEVYPGLFNLSSAFLYQYTFRTLSERIPEFVYVPFQDQKVTTDLDIIIHEWNMCWESGQLRRELFKNRLPAQLKWLKKFEDVNLYLLPDTKPKYEAYAPLYHLLPRSTLEYFSLPLFKKGIWPLGFNNYWKSYHLKSDFESQLSKAFAHHVWPLLIRGSKMRAFSKDDPIVILSHNLDYWLPYAYIVAESRLRSFPRVDLENSEQEHKLISLRKKIPSYIEVNRPLKGGDIWSGEHDAWEATKELIEIADRDGKLRSIIEAVKSNRVEDDFSKCWSYAREDFERKLYHKRSKIKVVFVQLNDTIPVHGPESECEENLLWEDFIALLDKKERKVVVCLRNGITKVEEISKLLGYANHSPISKALARIRLKAKQYFEID